MRRETTSFGVALGATVIAMALFGTANPALAHGGYPREWGGSTIAWRGVPRRRRPARLGSGRSGPVD